MAQHDDTTDLKTLQSISPEAREISMMLARLYDDLPRPLQGVAQMMIRQWWDEIAGTGPGAPPLAS